MAANFRSISASSQIKIGGGNFKGIFVSAASNTPLITVYDSGKASTSDPTILGVFVPAVGTYLMGNDDGGVTFSNGLYIVISGTVVMTALWT